MVSHKSLHAKSPVHKSLRDIEAVILIELKVLATYHFLITAVIHHNIEVLG